MRAKYCDQVSQVSMQGEVVTYDDWRNGEKRPGLFHSELGHHLGMSLLKSESS